MKDVFLSHASSDKDKYVRALAQELEQRGISVWLDEAEIAWGESISAKINQGLQQSKYVVVFLSINFVGRKWTEKELFSALHIETTGSRTVVLPIVVGDPKIVLASYPLLIDKVYCLWEEGIESIAQRIQQQLTTDQNNVERAVQGLLQRYFYSVTKRDLMGAYQCFSKAFRAENDLAKYENTFRKTARAILADYNLINHRHDCAYAHISVIATGQDQQNEIWRGMIELTYEEAEWRIQTMKGLKRATE